MHIVKRLYKEAVATPGATISPLSYPPDIFAVCCYFARVSGAYLFYSRASKEDSEKITDTAIKCGEKWRQLLDESLVIDEQKVPKKIRDTWLRIGNKINKSDTISQLTSDDDFVKDALFLIACADEACAGIGTRNFKRDNSRPTYFEFFAELRIQAGTLCKNVSAESVRVLPKRHTPQSGFNIRSLTHNLALCNASEVIPEWVQVPKLQNERSSYNILLAPWPLTINASDIKESKRAIDKDFGFFDFDLTPQNIGVKEWVEKLICRAQAVGQEIDLLLLPECALSIHEWDEVSEFVVEKGIAIISGVRHAPFNDDPTNINIGRNMLMFRIPLTGQEQINGEPHNSVEPDTSPKYMYAVQQHKHHRWRLDASQIGNYGLGSTLLARKGWWENIDLPERRLNFLAFGSDLVICPLICEDLARQDPVAELVRSVGPNLVIALLMDGPQIAERWSARYATVLADDPGSSVLTLTSLGMVELSRPSGAPAKRAIACWKEASGKFISLEIAPNESGLVLNLQFDEKREWSLDGRHDSGLTTIPALRGVHRLVI